MIKTEKSLLREMKSGASVQIVWGGYRLIRLDGTKASVLPKLIPNLAETGKIVRIDDRSSRNAEEWSEAK